LIEFKPATREKVKLRAALWGLNGSGKTLASLMIARALGELTYGIDTENGRMKLYADQFAFVHGDLPKTDRTPEGMRDAVRLAVSEGAGTVIVDSVSHEWLACLSDADRFGDWKNISPRHRDFFDELCSIPAHVIVTMRANIKYDVSEVVVDGRKKQTVTALGPGPVQGKGVEYEFDVLGQVDRDTHKITFENRCSALIGQTLAVEEAIPLLLDWLESGEPDPNMVKASEEKIAELRALLDAEHIDEAVIDDQFARQALRSGGVLTLGWVQEKIQAAHDRASGKQPPPPSAQTPVPKTWAEIGLLLTNAFTAVVLPDFEAFVVQAAGVLYNKPVNNLFGGKQEGNLTRAEWATLIQKAAGAAVNLVEAVDRELPPPDRAEMQAAFASVLGDVTLAGPDWALSPDDTDYPARSAAEPEK
jgi:hypothetical protein